MSIRFTDAGVLAMALMAVTMLLAYMRPKIAPESNWPLLYFIGLVLYQRMFEDILNPYPIFIGVVCAGMIRFEFMNLRFLKYFRWLELLMLIYVTWQLFGYVMYF